MSNNTPIDRVETDTSVTTSTGGKFGEMLKRSNSKIREDRAIAITEDAETYYRRAVEDMQMQLKRLQRDKDNMLDLSPTNADSLTLASDFNAPSFVEKDIDLGVKIRNLTIKLDVAQNNYKTLFGDI